MNTAKFFVIAAVLLVAPCKALNAQDIPSTVDTFGRIVVRSDLAVAPEKRAALVPGWRWSLTPSFVRFDGGDVLGASLRASFDRHTITLQDSSLGVEGLQGSLSSRKLEYSYGLLKGETASVDITASFADLEDSAQTSEISLGASRTLLSGDSEGLGAVDLVGSIGWAARNPDNPAARKIRDAKAAIGLQWNAAPQLVLAAEYSAINDFDRESLWGVRAIVYRKVILAYEEGQTWVAAFRIPLN